VQGVAGLDRIDKELLKLHKTGRSKMDEKTTQVLRSELSTLKVWINSTKIEPHPNVREWRVEARAIAKEIRSREFFAMGGRGF